MNSFESSLCRLEAKGLKWMEGLDVWWLAMVIEFGTIDLWSKMSFDVCLCRWSENFFSNSLFLIKLSTICCIQPNIDFFKTKTCVLLWYLRSICGLQCWKFKVKILKIEKVNCCFFATNEWKFQTGKRIWEKVTITLIKIYITTMYGLRRLV